MSQVEKLSLLIFTLLGLVFPYILLVPEKTLEDKFWVLGFGCWVSYEKENLFVSQIMIQCVMGDCFLPFGFYILCLAAEKIEEN